MWDNKLPARYSKLTPFEKKEVKAMYKEYQNGKCYYCKGDLKQNPPDEVANKKVKPYLYPNGFFDNPVHLHHDHNTDLTYGIVHAYCNAVLWEYHGE
jgi:hypothetical protein